MRFIDDLLDRRGTVRKSENTPVDVAISLVPAVVAGVLPLYGPVATALRHIPLAARLLHLLVPLIIIILAIHAVTARSRVARPGMTPPQKNAEYDYRYKSGARAVAKLLLLPVLLLLVFEAYDKLPNWMLRRKNVAGYVCDARSGSPLDVLVTVSDSLGATLTTYRRTDSTGYMSITLPSWGQRPVSMTTGSGCESIDLTASAPKTANGCPASAGRDLPPRAQVPLWSLSCAQRK